MSIQLSLINKTAEGISSSSYLVEFLAWLAAAVCEVDTQGLDFSSLQLIIILIAITFMYDSTSWCRLLPEICKAELNVMQDLIVFDKEAGVIVMISSFSVT